MWDFSESLSLSQVPSGFHDRSHRGEEDVGGSTPNVRLAGSHHWFVIHSCITKTRAIHLTQGASVAADGQDNRRHQHSRRGGSGGGGPPKRDKRLSEVQVAGAITCNSQHFEIIQCDDHLTTVRQRRRELDWRSRAEHATVHRSNNRLWKAAECAKGNHVLCSTCCGDPAMTRGKHEEQSAGAGWNDTRIFQSGSDRSPSMTAVLSSSRLTSLVAGEVSCASYTGFASLSGVSSVSTRMLNSSQLENSDSDPSIEMVIQSHQGSMATSLHLCAGCVRCC